jgi:NADH-quinone oxidoreductase subunit M
LELLITTLALGLISFIVPQKNIRLFGLIASLIPAGISIAYLMAYEAGSTVQLFDPGKVYQFGLTLEMSYDAIGLIMIVLTSLSIPIILLSNYNMESSRSKLFHALVFLMQFGMLGVFVASDGILFYVFWEFTLIPIFLILYWFGKRNNKVLLKFFLYTLVGSLAMLLSLIALGSKSLSFGYADLLNVQLSTNMAYWIMGGFLLAFAIKIPLAPFHTWQAETYANSSMAGTMLLSALMLKMALFGILKWMIPLAPEGLENFKWLVIVLGVGSVVYGGIICIKQNDIKKIFAYASVSHLGLITAGLFLFNENVLKGAMIQIINHSIVSIGLFLVAEILISRMNTHNIKEMGGVAKLAPKFGLWFTLILLVSISVPFTAGFIGEFILIKELSELHLYSGLLSATTLVFGAVYMLRTFQISMHSAPKTTHFEDLKWNELAVFIILMIFSIIFGLFPSIITNFMDASVTQLLNTFNELPIVK